MDARLQDLSFDPGSLRGLSEQLLRSHHQNNYGGAVRRLNAIRAQLADLNFVSAQGFHINGLKREELIATNSMLLHELYFDCLGSGAPEMAPAMALALQASFGSVERWRDEFVSMGKALGGGSGWVLLTFQPREGTLVNQWAGDHANAVAGGIPVLALDMYEHSYHRDYGAAAGKYVDAFMDNVHWDRVYERYQHAVEGASDGIAATHDDLQGARLLDVRRAGVFAQAPTVIPGAIWRDPQAIASWSRTLSAGEPVVVYCVHGHEVGRSTAMRLRAAGIDARFLRGGIEGWQTAGREVAPKSTISERQAPASPPSP